MDKKFFSVFVYNGEIWVSDMSGLGANSERFKEMMMESELHIGRPANRYRVALDVYDTNFDKETAFLLAKSVERTQKNIIKLGIKGMSLKGRFHFERKLGALGVSLAIKYFRDWELCKQWLVAEGA